MSEKQVSMGFINARALTVFWASVFWLFQAKEKLIERVENFIKEKITLAGEAISKTYAIQKVDDGDIIMTYAW